MIDYQKLYRQAVFLAWQEIEQLYPDNGRFTAIRNREFQRLKNERYRAMAYR